MPPTLNILAEYQRRTPGSARLFRRATQCIPGGIVTDTRYFEPYGIYIERAAEVHKWDVDGNRYLDFFGGHGANMLGHAHPAIVSAVGDAVGRGTQYAANQPLEIVLAEMVQRLLPAAERVRFTGSGTEATLLAIRLARAFTQRQKIVRFASHYHGWHDHAASGWVAEFDGSPAPGILPAVTAETLLLPPGDSSALERTFEAQGQEIAAVLVEPCGTHFGVVPLDSQFLHDIERNCKRVGALFILDEVLSGFRVAPGGAQELFELRPDLTTLAKVLCGGMPGGAVAGRANVMNLLDFDADRRGAGPKVMHQGTFSANPVSMAAGLAMLRIIASSDACDRANRLGALARLRFNEILSEEHLALAFYGEFSAFHLFANPANRPIDPLRPIGHASFPEYLARPHPLLNRLRMALNVAGMDVNTKCSGLLSSAHGEQDVEAACEMLRAALRMLRRDRIL